jgi:hypothetical protein
VELISVLYLVTPSDLTQGSASSRTVLVERVWKIWTFTPPLDLVVTAVPGSHSPPCQNDASETE